MRVLLIIDMQKAMFSPDSPMFDLDGVIKRINFLADILRQYNGHVIFIQHAGSSEEFCMPGTDGFEILPSLSIKEDDLLISKTANDSFYRTKLQEQLDHLDVDELIVTGISTDFCIDATIKAAIVKDYNVTVISNAHTTDDKPHLKAKQIIDHYNWVWQMMPATKSKISVVSLEDYSKAINA
jgi:nicotinamidase-related amidase